MANLLNYIESKQISDDFTRRLDDEVAMVRENKEWMVEYMKTLVHDMDVRNEGRAEGRAEVIISFLEDYGEVPEYLKAQIYSETDINIIKKWVKLSSAVSSVAEFEEKMRK